jgi:hypothetical protein
MAVAGLQELPAAAVTVAVVVALMHQDQLRPLVLVVVALTDLFL